MTARSSFNVSSSARRQLFCQRLLALGLFTFEAIRGWAGPLPPGWQAAAFGRGGALVTNASVEYDSGTWNVKTGPTRSAIVSQNLSGDVSVVMKLTDASGQANAHLGIMMWSSLALTAGKAGLVVDPTGQKIYFSWDEATDRAQLWANYIQAEGLGFPVWLKLTRSGSYFAGYYSKDGQEWRAVGVPVKTFWAGKRPEIVAGVYGDGVCEQRFTDLLISASRGLTFPAPLPEGWKMDLQGQPAFVGEVREESGTWTLAGASPIGRGGYHNVTALKSVSAKVQLTAKIRVADLSDPRAGGGLLLSAHDIDAGIMAYPAGGKLVIFTRQNSTGRALQNRTIPIPSTLTGKAEGYLRLALVEGRVAGFYGATPNEMTPVGDVLTVNELAADVSGGMELSGGSGSRLTATVRFEDFQAQDITTLPGQPVAAQVAAVNSTSPRVQTQSPRPTTAPVSYPVSYPAPRRSSGLGGIIVTLIFFLVVIALVLIKPFNRLVYLRNRARKGWAQIDVQLKRRHDLIGNYVETVKGYAKHESGTLEGVARARSAAANATSVGDRAKAEATLNVTMRSLYAVVEAYPQLKADQHFLALQGNLKDTEDKLAGARNDYNEEVMIYNTGVQSFPTNLIAMIFRFKERDFFEVSAEQERESPKAAI